MNSLFCYSIFCHFPGNFIISSSHNFLLFWAKNCSSIFYSLLGDWIFSPLREFCKDQNKWKSEGAMSGEYGGWIRTSQPPSCNSFCLVVRETCSLTLSWWKIMYYLLTNAECFSSSVTFSWPNWEQHLLELISFDFPEGVYSRGLFSIPPYMQHHILWMKTGLWCGCWWFISLTPSSSAPHYCTVSTSHCCHNLF